MNGEEWFTSKGWPTHYQKKRHPIRGLGTSRQVVTTESSDSLSAFSLYHGCNHSAASMVGEGSSKNSFADIKIIQSSSSALEPSTLMGAPDSCLICLIISPSLPITPPTFPVGQTRRKENSFAEDSSLRVE